MPMSTAGADWVMRPTETKSTPVSAIAGAVSRVTPPAARNGRGLGEAADRDEVDAGLGNCADRLEVHPARSLQRHAPSDQLDRFAKDLRRHVVEQQPVGPRRERFADLLDAVDL